ncbi:hypothetical protein PoB_000585000 [Plakobranchus ocellatus]|uniref:Uncharacterized protein n=1 Tax=Plakobranchus ocellatus TaxID=259542 RepID=A0AAV3YA16_9GAST|nr:hypothetical protein PoB_000585000 [Plakobranchus ocellatus]
MGNSCKGTLASCKGEMLTVTGFQRHSEESNFSVPSPNPQQSKTFPINVIQVVPKRRSSDNLTVCDSTNEATIVDGQNMVLEVQAEESLFNLSNRTDADFDKCQACSHSSKHGGEKHSTPIKREANRLRILIGNVEYQAKPPKMDKPGAIQVNTHTSVSLEQAEVIYESDEPKLASHKADTESSEVKDGQTRQDKSKKSFDSIETLSLENEEMPDYTVHTNTQVQTGSLHNNYEMVRENTKTPVFVYDNKTHKESKELNLDASPHAVWKSQSPSPDDSPLDEASHAIINLFHTLYHGKRRKYHGWSSFRGKARNPAKTISRKSNWPYDDGRFVKHDEIRDSQEFQYVDLKDKSDIYSPCTIFKPVDHHAETGPDTNNSPTRDASFEYQCLQSKNDSTLDRQLTIETCSNVQKLPFNLYKERKQTVSQFPLADFRFDDRTYSSSDNLTFEEKQKEKSNHGNEAVSTNSQCQEKSLASALSFAGSLLRGFSLADSAPGRMHTTRLGLNFRAGASLNDIFVNVTSSLKLKKDASSTLKEVTKEISKAQSEQISEQISPNMARKEIKDCLIKCKQLTECKRQQKRLESLEEMFKPIQSERQPLDTIKRLIRPCQANCSFADTTESHNSDVCKSSQLKRQHESPFKPHNFFEGPVFASSTLVTPVSATVVTSVAHSILCSSPQVAMHWQKSPLAQSCNQNQNDNQYFKISPLPTLLFREREKIVASRTNRNSCKVTDKGSSLQSSFDKVLESPPLNKDPKNIADVYKKQMIQKSIHVCPCKTENYSQSMGLLAARDGVDSRSSRLVYSRHMNKLK